MNTNINTDTDTDNDIEIFGGITFPPSQALTMNLASFSNQIENKDTDYLNYNQEDYLQYFLMLFDRAINDLPEESRDGKPENIEYKQAYLDFLVRSIATIKETAQLDFELNNPDNIQENKNVLTALYHFLIINRFQNIEDYISNIIIEYKDEIRSYIEENYGTESVTSIFDRYNFKKANRSKYYLVCLFNCHKIEIIDYILTNILTFESFKDIIIEEDPYRIDNIILKDIPNFEISQDFLLKYFNTFIESDFISWILYQRIQTHLTKEESLLNNGDS